ncbi:MAG: type II secretion system F family protein [Patescibacteria group bacterium]|nr:type II secretion system F family protein [Patescibacteria group bacterium]
MSVRLKSSEKLEMISNLSAMLSAGIPLLEAVDAMLDGAKARTKSVLTSLRKDLESGKTIADSFAQFPDSFDPVAVNLIHGAEQAGDLEQVLKDLAESIRRDIEFTSKVRGALAYPIFVMVIFVIIMVVILSFVIPRISEVFSKLRVTIPLPTQILIWMSGIMLGYWPWIVAGSATAIAGGIWLYRVRRRQMLNALSGLPFIRHLAREIDLVRFTRSAGLLLRSGIPIEKTLELARDVVVRKELTLAIESSRQDVMRGKRLSESLRAHGDLIPQILIRMIAAGEKSGKLDESFQEAADYFDNRVTTTIKSLTTLLEPVLLVIVGVAVGAIMVSIIAPIYQLVGQIKVR